MPVSERGGEHDDEDDGVWCYSEEPGSPDDVILHGHRWKRERDEARGLLRRLAQGEPWDHIAAEVYEAIGGHHAG